jgi:uncharacterized protein (DUF58 family)
MDANSARSGSPAASTAGPRGPLRWLLRGRRPPRQLRFTREGKFFTFVTFGVGVAAINTGNNLLYLVLGLLLSLIVLSGVLSEISLRSLTFRRRLPRRAFAGAPLLVEIEVMNNKTWAPSYSVEVEDRLQDRVTDKRCYFLKVSPGAKQTAAYRRVAPVRGRERYTGLRVATRFPFGLFEKWREVEIDEEHVVFPSPMLKGEPPGALSHERGGATPRRQRGSGDVDGLRELRDGEPAREIDWKKSAQSVGPLIARERASEANRVVRVELRNGPSERDRPHFAAAFEHDLRVAAGRLSRALDRGSTVELRAHDGGAGRPVHLTLSSAEQLDLGLRFLALLPPIPTPTEGQG